MTRRSHHIADIAHHFLAGMADDTDAGLPAVWIVASAGPWPWSASAVLELARLAARDSRRLVHLAEEDDLPWTVRSLLGEGDREVRLAYPGEPVAHGDGPLCWHLGPTTGDRLEDLAAARRAPGCRLPGDGRKVGLVWCVGYGQADGWTALTALGRLVAVVEPVRVDVICMPERLNRSGRGDGVSPPGATTLALLQERARDACAREVGVHVLAPHMSAAARGAVMAGLYGRTDAFCAGPDRAAPLA